MSDETVSICSGVVGGFWKYEDIFSGFSPQDVRSSTITGHRMAENSTGMPVGPTTLPSYDGFELQSRMGTSRLCEMLISHAYASPEQDLREPTTPNDSQRCGLPRHIAPSSGDPTLPDRDDQQYSASPHGHAYSGGLLRELSLTAERYRLAECLREANHLVHGRTDDGDDFPWLFPSPWQSKHASDDSVNSPAAYVTSAVQLDCSSGYDRVVENYSDGVRCILDDLTSSEGSCYDYARGDNVGSFEHYWRREAEIQATYGAYRSEYVASSESLRQDVDAVVEKASQEQPTDCELQPTDCELQPTDCEQQLTDSEQRSTDCELSPCSSQESSDVGVAITTDGAANATASPEASNGREEEVRATQATSSGVGSGEKRKRSTPRKSINKLDPEFRGVTLHIRTTLRNNESRVTIETYFTRTGSKARRRLKKSPFAREERAKRQQRPACPAFSSGKESCSSSESDEHQPPPRKLYYCYHPFSKSGKQCASCRTHKTPLWRDAEDGTPLCNACGIRYKKYRIRCSHCWHIPKKDAKSFPNCSSCGSPLRYSAFNRRVW